MVREQAGRPSVPGEVRGVMSIRTAVFASLLGGVVLLTVAIAAYVPDYLRTITLRVAEREVTIRTKAVAVDLARLIHVDWTEVKYLAGIVNGLGPSSARDHLNGVVGSGERESWAGYANADGIVLVASGGLLEGADVSERPWFRGAFRGPYAGDVHEAVLLQNLLRGAGSEPLRFIDLAGPVLDDSGLTVGVISFHMNFNWVSTYLEEAASVRGMDFLLLDSAGSVAASSFSPTDGLETVGAIRAGAAGVATTILEQWPDGREYISSVTPDVAFSDLPGFGWRLVGRTSTDAYRTDFGQFLFNVLLFAAVASIIFAIAATLFVAVFLRPLSGLIGAADKISRGEHAYPEETRSSREAAVLANALARIQARLSGN